MFIQDLERQIKDMKNGKKVVKNKFELSPDNYISSSDVESSDSGHSKTSANFYNLESPIVKFPDKIHMKKNTSLNNSAIIPKLDLSIVKNKYATQNNKVTIAEPQQKSNRSNHEYIEKLKFQLKICKNTISIYKKKLDKYKTIVESNKIQIKKLKTRNELLELQQKKSGASTNDETSHKNYMNNTSMVKLI